MRREHLRAVVPISLVTVVLLGVVAGCDIHTTLTAEVTDGVRNLGSGTQILEKIDLYSIGREDVSRNFGKQTAVVTAVVAHNNRNLLKVFEALVQIVGQALCGTTHCIDVHTVASCAHNTAQATCTKLKLFVKSINKGGLILVVEHCLNLLTCFLVISGREPLVGLLCYHFNKFLIHRFLLLS